MNIIEAFAISFSIEASGFAKGEREINDRTRRLNDGNKRAFDDMERRGQALGESLKGVSREVIGLGLAVLGATSITGLITQMATGAATADRLGKTMGMTTRQVWAWRMAMGTVGGTAAEADASLKAIQGAKMSYRMGHMDPATGALYTRLGITGYELRNSSAGDILKQIASAQGRIDPQLYSSLLQQIGLAPGMINFMNTGARNVDHVISTMERNAKGQEQLAKQTEELQAQITKLTATLESAVVPPLTILATLLNDLISLIPKEFLKNPIGATVGADPNAQLVLYTWQQMGKFLTKHGWTKSGKLFTDLGHIADGNKSPPPPSSTAKPSAASPHSSHGTRAERNNNPGNIRDGAFARRQPGYVGSDGAFARFDTASHGYQAMLNLLLGRGYAGDGRDTIASIIAKWAPGNENDTASYIADVVRQTGFGKYEHLRRLQIVQVAKAMARHEGYGAPIHINNLTVHTQATDGHAIMRDIQKASERKRRLSVRQVDPGVRP